MRKFIVYILTDNPSSYEVEKLSDIFDYKNFDVHYLTTKNYQDPINNRQLKSMNKYEASKKYYNKNILTRVTKALQRSYDLYDDGYTIIIKDTSICSIDPNNLYDILKNTKKFKDWDICYLTKWMDRSDLCEDIKYCDYGIDLIRTFSPHGIQTLMFSPSGRNRILGIQPMRNGNYFTPIESSLDEKLNKCIENEDLFAVGYSTNLFIYNPSKMKSNKDIHKFSMWRENPHKNKQEYSYDISMYVSVVAISVLILVLFHIGRK